MVWYPAYLTDKTEIVEWAQDQRPDLTTGMIPDSVIRMSDTMIWMTMADDEININYTGTVSGSAEPVPGDINNFLWAASLAFTLEQLSMRGTIHYTHGGIEKAVFGQVTHQFMRMQPMFFIPRGDQGLDRMMPFRSFKQMGQQFVRAWIRAYIKARDGTMIAKPVVGFDLTARGWGWNAASGFMNTADALSSGLSDI